MQVDSRVLGLNGTRVCMLFKPGLQGLFIFAHINLITVIAGTHNTIHKVGIKTHITFHVTKTAGQCLMMCDGIA